MEKTFGSYRFTLEKKADSYTLKCQQEGKNML